MIEFIRLRTELTKLLFCQFYAGDNRITGQSQREFRDALADGKAEGW